jgi:hypothetical protein
LPVRVFEFGNGLHVPDLGVLDQIKGQAELPQQRTGVFILRRPERSNIVPASDSFRKLTGPAVPIGEDQQRPEPGRNVRLIVGFERLLVRLACPSHVWSWPRPIPGEKVDRFDAHQTCFKCSTERFYNTSTLRAGPLYRSTASETRLRSAGDFRPLDALKKKLSLLTDLGRQLLKRAKSLRA